MSPVGIGINMGSSYLQRWSTAIWVWTKLVTIASPVFLPLSYLAIPIMLRVLWSSAILSLVLPIAQPHNHWFRLLYSTALYLTRYNPGQFVVWVHLYRWSWFRKISTQSLADCSGSWGFIINLIVVLHCPSWVKIQRHCNDLATRSVNLDLTKTHCSYVMQGIPGSHWSCLWIVA